MSTIDKRPGMIWPIDANPFLPIVELAVETLSAPPRTRTSTKRQWRKIFLTRYSRSGNQSSIIDLEIID
jgi:hypothetical protein